MRGEFGGAADIAWCILSLAVALYELVFHRAK
jgi:hypothetical protein